MTVSHTYILEELVTDSDLFLGGQIPSLAVLCQLNLQDAGVDKLCAEYKSWLRMSKIRYWADYIGRLTKILVCVLGLITNICAFVVICRGAFRGSMRIFFLALAGRVNYGKCQIENAKAL